MVEVLLEALCIIMRWLAIIIPTVCLINIIKLLIRGRRTFELYTFFFYMGFMFCLSY